MPDYSEIAISRKPVTQIDTEREIARQELIKSICKDPNMLGKIIATAKTSEEIRAKEALNSKTQESEATARQKATELASVNKGTEEYDKALVTSAIATMESAENIRAGLELTITDIQRENLGEQIALIMAQSAWCEPYKTEE